MIPGTTMVFHQQKNNLKKGIPGGVKGILFFYFFYFKNLHNCGSVFEEQVSGSNLD